MIYYMVNSGLFQEEVIFLYCIEKKSTSSAEFLYF